MTATLRPPRHPARRGLLAYGEQLRLARAVEAGRDADRRLDEVRRMPAAERRSLELVAEEGQRARRELVEAHAPLVLTEARRYLGGDRSTLVELVQQGNIGLVRAIDSFDWRRGERFSVYASQWIRLAIESERPDLPDPRRFRPDPVVLSIYRDRVVSLDGNGDRAGDPLAGPDATGDQARRHEAGNGMVWTVLDGGGNGPAAVSAGPTGPAGPPG